jgi:hypothetical protein
MLKNIPDPRMREMYGNILSGKYAYKVYCLDPHRNPDTKKPYHAKQCLIGYIMANGQVMDNLTLNKEGHPIAGIETSRDRFDGRKGFKCYCGNWSIQSPEEQGILEQSVAPMPPTKKQLEDIFAKVQGKPPLSYDGGRAVYDGFMLEEVKA